MNHSVLVLSFHTPSAKDAVHSEKNSLGPNRYTNSKPFIATPPSDEHLTSHNTSSHPSKSIHNQEILSESSLPQEFGEKIIKNRCILKRKSRNIDKSLETTLIEYTADNKSNSFQKEEDYIFNFDRKLIKTYYNNDNDNDNYNFQLINETKLLILNDEYFDNLFFIDESDDLISISSLDNELNDSLKQNNNPDNNNILINLCDCSLDDNEKSLLPISQPSELINEYDVNVLQKKKNITVKNISNKNEKINILHCFAQDFSTKNKHHGHNLRKRTLNIKNYDDQKLNININVLHLNHLKKKYLQLFKNDPLNDSMYLKFHKASEKSEKRYNNLDKLKFLNDIDELKSFFDSLLSLLVNNTSLAQTNNFETDRPNSTDADSIGKETRRLRTRMTNQINTSLAPTSSSIIVSYLNNILNLNFNKNLMGFSKSQVLVNIFNFINKLNIKSNQSKNLISLNNNLLNIDSANNAYSSTPLNLKTDSSNFKSMKKFLNTQFGYPELQNYGFLRKNTDLNLDSLLVKEIQGNCNFIPSNFDYGKNFDDSPNFSSQNSEPNFNSYASLTFNSFNNFKNMLSNNIFETFETFETKTDISFPATLTTKDKSILKILSKITYINPHSILMPCPNNNKDATNSVKSPTITSLKNLNYLFLLIILSLYELFRILRFFKIWSFKNQLIIYNCKKELSKTQDRSELIRNLFSNITYQNERSNESFDHYKRLKNSLEGNHFQNNRQLKHFLQKFQNKIRHKVNGNTASFSSSNPIVSDKLYEELSIFISDSESDSSDLDDIDDLSNVTGSEILTKKHIQNRNRLNLEKELLDSYYSDQEENFMTVDEIREKRKKKFQSKFKKFSEFGVGKGTFVNEKEEHNKIWKNFKPIKFFVNNDSTLLLLMYNIRSGLKIYNLNEFFKFTTPNNSDDNLNKDENKSSLDPKNEFFKNGLLFEKQKTTNPDNCLSDFPKINGSDYIYESGSDKALIENQHISLKNKLILKDELISNQKTGEITSTLNNKNELKIKKKKNSDNSLLAKYLDEKNNILGSNDIKVDEMASTKKVSKNSNRHLRERKSQIEDLKKTSFYKVKVKKQKEKRIMSKKSTKIRNRKLLLEQDRKEYKSIFVSFFTNPKEKELYFRPYDYKLQSTEQKLKDYIDKEKGDPAKFSIYITKRKRNENTVRTDSITHTEKVIKKMKPIIGENCFGNETSLDTTEDDKKGISEKNKNKTSRLRQLSKIDYNINELSNKAIRYKNSYLKSNFDKDVGQEQQSDKIIMDKVENDIAQKNMNETIKKKGMMITIDINNYVTEGNYRVKETGLILPEWGFGKPLPYNLLFKYGQSNQNRCKSIESNDFEEFQLPKEFF
ncbi:uncharacterized protein ASCRUDRAFT_71516 [Ascoidea rubescens DSM 1968]|uniref:Something about silencing protein 4 domain-containing protein n=1 Tax=Ascoidea rubescens DSM 1968 TaxID=1344418 RepID=A0A1D2VCY4_9ASCO|nr:hypothetical protein ASCRUDRAFT_71516 [Ascoidea rubescens DSM 1968]ODV59558.1 hypothetical protein ASCRUDRAFT_71516 [Ascoidea rubescens DSM 1968]